MLSALTLSDRDGTDIALLDPANGKGVVSLTGLVGSASVRDTKRTKPQRRGGINPDAFTDGALMAGSFEAWSTVDVKTAFATFRAMTKPMLETLTYGQANSSSACVLKWTESTDGLALQRVVKLCSEIDPPLANNAAMLTFQAQFFAEDPRAFSQAQTTYTGAALAAGGGGWTFGGTSGGWLFGGSSGGWTFTSSGGGTLTVLNAGRDDSPPIWRIYGYCQNPQIVNLATHERFVIVGTVAANSYLEIDVANGTVKLNGTTDVANLVQSSTSTWFECLGATATNPTGATNVQLVASDYDSGARVDCLLRAAY